MSAAQKKNSPESSQSTAAEPQRWHPHAYQLKAVKWLLSHAGAGLFLDPGLGKTSINLAALKVLKQEGELRDGALVVCPLRPLYNVWDPEGEDSEPHKWLDFHSLTFSLLHGDGKDAALRRKADIYLLNPDGLEWFFSSVRPSRLRGMLLDVDESTQFKHANTERFKLLRPYLPLFRRRWINTGTPSPNGLLDLFGQLYICDMGNALGAYITHYRRSFFEPTGFGGYSWVLQGAAIGKADPETGLTPAQDKTARRIYKAVEPLILRMDEKDYLRLPKIHGSLAHSPTPNFTEVRLPREAQKKFDQLEELFFVDMESGGVTAANAAVKHMKLRQAANGGIYLDKEVGADGLPKKGKREWAHLHDAKTDAVVELLDEMDGRSAVIAIEFRHDVERLRMSKRLRNVPAIGEEGPRVDRLLASDFNRGKVRELLVNPASFSKGSNMQAMAHALIFHSMIWNFEDYDQLIRRFYRQGRKMPFWVHHVVARGTHDMLIAGALRGKNRTQRSLLDALREYSKRRPRLHSGRRG